MDNSLKSISKTDDEIRVANYIVLFGGKDLTGEHFSPKTKFESSYTKSGILHVDFEHGFDPDRADMGPDEVLGYIDWRTAKTDETGIFVERVLNRRAKYMAQLEMLIEKGMVGTSSQAINGKSKRLDDGHIIEWPLMRDSLTFTPAEPRMLSGNALKSARELYRAFPESKSLSIVEDICEIKPQIDEAKSLKDIERLLRDAGGFSRAESVAMVARIKSMVRSESEPEPKAEIAEVFHQFKL